MNGIFCLAHIVSLTLPLGTLQSVPPSIPNAWQVETYLHDVLPDFWHLGEELQSEKAADDCEGAGRDTTIHQRCQHFHYW